MKPYCEIKFTTTRSTGDLNEGKTCYQGHLHHNTVLSEAETRQAFADYCCEPRSRTDRYIDALGEFIAQEIAHGDYWIVVQSRCLKEPNLIRCRRRIKVV